MLDRLELAVERLLEKNRNLSVSCRQLEEEKLAWEAERKELLDRVEEIIARLDQHLEEEDV